MIGEMLGGGEGLSYKARKKKKDPNQQSFGEKLSNLFVSKKKLGGSTDSLSKPRTKSQIQNDVMDNYWTDYDYLDKNYSQICKMPPTSDDTKMGSTMMLNGPLLSSPGQNSPGMLTRI